MDKITTIVGKEWSEVFKNKLVLFSVPVSYTHLDVYKRQLEKGTTDYTDSTDSILESVKSV